MSYFEEGESFGRCRIHGRLGPDGCDRCDAMRCQNPACAAAYHPDYFVDGLCEDCQGLERCEYCGEFRDPATAPLCLTCLPIMLAEAFEELGWTVYEITFAARFGVGRRVVIDGDSPLDVGCSKS